MSLFKKTLLGLTAVAGGVYALMLGALYLRQDKIIFMSSKDHPLQRLFLERWGERASEYEIPADEDLPTLRGWYVASQQQSDTLVIYFGGNAEHIDNVLFLASNVPQVDMVAMHYRGYGLSEGSPSEEGLYKDALRVVDHLHVLHPDKKIVLFGRSLGTGVALYVASRRQQLINQVILTTPYDSLEAVAKRHYSWVPVRTLLKHRFNALASAPLVSCPVHIIVASKDEYIPLSHARKLEKALCSHTTVSWSEVPEADHSNIHDWNLTWTYINKFIAPV